MTSSTFERQNPIDKSIASVAVASSVAEAIAAATAAATAQADWAALGPNARRNYLLNAAQELELRQTEFAAAMASEIGSTASWAGFNVHLAKSMLIEAASLSTQVGGEIIPSDVPSSLAFAQRVPAGVVLAIAPWNAPIILAIRAIAVPLACGNTVVFKASEICPSTHRLVVEAFAAAGLPTGVLNYVSNAPTDAAQVVQALIAHPSVRRVNFTGSTKIGRIIAQTCATHLKQAVLELGGKAPIVILDDADIDKAVQATCFGAFANSGQICMSTERIIVDTAIADSFTKALTEKVSSLSISDPRDVNATPSVLGAVFDTSTVERCNALIRDALSKGATLLCGGIQDTVLMKATLLDHVTCEMNIYYEESFGPVKPIVRVNGVEAAIACANDNEYGLSAAVFGKDIARAWQVANRIESGMCHVNGPTVHDEAQMPFGGMKASGYGRFGGKAGIDAFTELRWLTIQTAPRHYPF